MRLDREINSIPKDIKSDSISKSKNIDSYVCFGILVGISLVALILTLNFPFSTFKLMNEKYWDKYTFFCCSIHSVVLIVLGIIGLIAEWKEKPDLGDEEKKILQFVSIGCIIFEFFYICILLYIWKKGTYEYKYR